MRFHSWMETPSRWNNFICPFSYFQCLQTPGVRHVRRGCSSQIQGCQQRPVSFNKKQKMTTVDPLWSPVHKPVCLRGWLSFVQLAFILISIHCLELSCSCMNGQSVCSKLLTKLRFNYYISHLSSSLPPKNEPPSQIELRETESSCM